MAEIGLGEREIIAELTRKFDIKPRFPLGFDDDVALYPIMKTQLVLKSDVLVGSTDVPPGMTVQQAARKAVVGTVSDFAAKGVQPRGMLIALGLASPVRASTVKEIAAGLAEAAREYGCRIIGGDTSQTKDLIINCIGFGFAAKGRITPRNGATPGDIVAVTGDFGKTAAGLRILMARKRKAPGRYNPLVRSVLRPVARLQTGLRLARTRAVTSSIDSSDGLAWSVSEIARLSKVNIVLSKVPVAQLVASFARDAGLDPDQLALYGGEEYELVVTIKPERFEALRNSVHGLRKIGRVERGNGIVDAVINGKMARLEPRGYEHFQ